MVCQTPIRNNVRIPCIVSQSPVRIHSIVSQSLSEYPGQLVSPCQNPLYIIVSQFLSEFPGQSVGHQSESNVGIAITSENTCIYSQSLSEMMSESPVKSINPCQNPLYSQSVPVTISWIVSPYQNILDSQSLSEYPGQLVSPCQNPLYLIVSQSLSESPGQSVGHLSESTVRIAITSENTCIYSQSLLESTVQSVLCQNILYSQLVPSAGMHCTVSKSLTEFPVQSVSPLSESLVWSAR